MLSQYQRVKKVLEDADAPLALFQIREKILERFVQTDSDSAISARIRDIRHDLDQDKLGTIINHRVPGKAYVRYELVRSECNTLAASA